MQCCCLCDIVLWQGLNNSTGGVVGENAYSVGSSTRDDGDGLQEQ
jgi:hypothetical protein